MNDAWRSRIGIGLFSVLLGAVPVPLAAQDIPLRNWTVPSSVSGGLGKTVDATPPRPFIGLPPCRLLDTRATSSPPPFLGPIYADSDLRNYVLWGQCGVPSGADAVSVNLTVTGSPSAPPAAFLLAFPTGSPPFPVVSTLNFQAGQTVANAAIVPLNGSGSLSLNVSHSTHVIMDINGYFSDMQGTTSNSFLLTGQVNFGGVIVGVNSSAAGLFSPGVQGTQTGSGVGVFGQATAVTGRTYGLYGTTESIDLGAAGVFGVDGTGIAAASFFPSAGVRGESRTAFGVLGVTRENAGDAAVAGVLATALGAPVVQGSLAHDAGANVYGVFSFGDYGGNGAKYFVEPHPRQADLVIRYVALEGPESGTYFRGKGKFQNGLATIEVPEDFRMVTDEEGLSVQVTPIGEMASFAVLRVGLDRIVVKSSKNVEFFYMVNGVRRSHKHLRSVGPGQEYMPESPGATMPAYLTDVQKQMLISNGTYKADGTVNLETAKALGWVKVWEKRAKRSGADSSGGLQ